MQSHTGTLAVLEGRYELSTRQSGQLFDSNGSTLVINHATLAGVHQEPSTNSQSSASSAENGDLNIFQRNNIMSMEVAEVMNLPTEVHDGSSLSTHSVEQHPRNKYPYDSFDSLLHRERLESLGATFSDDDELLTYGIPSSPSDFEDMIRYLGPRYDAGWMSSRRADNSTSDSHMWPDLRVLKKVLLNEGVFFNADHEHIVCEDSSPKVLLLAVVYGFIYQQWLEFMGAVLHEDSQGGMQDASPAVSTANNPEIENGMTSTVTEEVPDEFLQYMAQNQIEVVPRNLGWRFSDGESSVPGWAEAQPLLFRITRDSNSASIWNADAPELLNVDMNIQPTLQGVSARELPAIPKTETVSRGSSKLHNQKEVSFEDARVMNTQGDMPESTLNALEVSFPDVEPIDLPVTDVAHEVKKQSRVRELVCKAFVKGALQALPHHF
ncbi:hypothetical protein NX059_001701 [Plenodomus lindquistii]|nr:hypothetical protein NX059_001701 [Plenodomus lindquistii]